MKIQGHTFKISLAIIVSFIILIIILELHSMLLNNGMLIGYYKRYIKSEVISNVKDESLEENNNEQTNNDDLINQNPEYVETNNDNMNEEISETTNSIKAIEIVIHENRATTVYIKGVDTQLDLNGIRLKVTKDNGTAEEMELTKDGIKISGFDGNVRGLQTIKVEYKGYETSFEVRVKEVESISIVNPKTTYIKGMPQLQAEKILLTYTNGNTGEIRTSRYGVKVTGYDLNKLGKQKVTVKFANKETSYDITVKGSPNIIEDSPYHNNIKDVYWGQGSISEKLNEYYYPIEAENINENNPLFTLDTLSSTYFNEIDKLIENYKGYVTKKDLGVAYTSKNGTEYHCYSYTFRPENIGNKKIPKIIITSGQHGVEKGSIFGIYWFIDDLLNHSDDAGQDFLKYVRNNVELIILPCMNPYGLNNDLYTNENNININRNYDINFTPNTKNSGDSAFSETESRMIRDVINANKDNTLLFIDFHTHAFEMTKPNYKHLYYFHYMPNAEEDYYSRKLLVASSEFNKSAKETFKRYGAPDNAYMGEIRLNENAAESTAREWVNNLNILSVCLEGFDQLPDEIEKYNVDIYRNDYRYSHRTQKGNAEIFGNYIRLALKELSTETQEIVSIEGSTITLEKNTYVYDGTPKEPTEKVILANGKTLLTKDIDYTVDYNNNKYPGTAKIIIKGKGNYEGTVEKTFTINKKPIGECDISLEYTTCKYDGKEKKPTVTVKRGDKTISEGYSYTVQYQNNVNAGTAKIIIEGMGYYKDSTEKTFTIEKAENPLKVTALILKYNGEEQELVTVKNGQGAVYFNVGIALYGTNYQDKGNTKVPTKKSPGTYNVYYYTPGNNNYAEKNGKVDVVIEECKLQSITVTTKPNKTNYIEGQDFDKTGMVVKALYEDGTSKEVNNYTILDGEQLKVEQKSITISYTETSITKKVEQRITVEHNYIAKVTEPTCTEKGYTTYKCTECGDTYIENETEALGHNYENGVCTRCGNKEPVITVTSSDYRVDKSNNYITQIKPNTTAKELIEKIKTNATEVRLYKKNNELAEDDKIGTGVKIVLRNEHEEETYTLAVSGDVDENGTADFWDMLAINKHRLKTEELGEVEAIAGDVNNDGVTDFWDMLEINKYRLGLKNTF